MKFCLILGITLPVVFCLNVFVCFSGGITPEEIYQQNLDLRSLLGTWEKLPEVNPLAEKSVKNPDLEFRTLLTLRKDGTCRVFDGSNVSGTDGTWKSDNHNVFVDLPGNIRIEFFVYGVKGDFMVTRSPLENGLDQLWSRVK